MPFVIRHKETGEIVKMRSGKSVWAKIAHAKASFRTSGLTSRDRIRFDYKPDPEVLGANGLRLGRGAWGFEHQDLFEIVEAKLESTDGSRFCFKQDDDCHNYLIPVEYAERFTKLLADEDDTFYFDFNSEFEQYRIGAMTNWTFTDPKESA